MSADAARILVVEDEAPIRKFLRAALEAHGYCFDEARTTAECLMHMTSHPPELVLLDLGLPDGDGVELVRRIREWSAVPIVILSARDRESDKVGALDAGADDYVTKPFGMPELLARLRAALRRAAGTGRQASAQYAWSDALGAGFRIDLARRLVWRRGVGETESELRLTPTEYRLLAFLAQHAGRVITHSSLLRGVWGAAHVGDVAYLRVYMAQLRAKIEPEPAQPRWLITEPGVGYRLVDPDEDGRVSR